MMDFIKEIHEARMTSGTANTKKLTYNDCCERLYLTLLVLETMRHFGQFKPSVQSYAKKTAGFETYRYYRIMGTDLYNFIYFITGDDSAQAKLSDPDAAKQLKRQTRVPRNDINRYINELAQMKEPTLVSNLFIALESSLRVNQYKPIRRALINMKKLNKHERHGMITKLIYAVRAKLRSSDIINDFERFAAIKDFESEYVRDNEPTISKPDIPLDNRNIALYRYLVGTENLMMTKRFIEMAQSGKSIPANVVQAYLPAIKYIDDIVQAGPAFVQNLQALHKRAKKSR